MRRNLTEKDREEIGHVVVIVDQRKNWNITI